MSDLIGEIECAFDLAEHLLGILAIDPQAMPINVITLEKFGEQVNKKFSMFLWLK